jgi:threonylcarbamoyladenosine tRNA methylthiotransferase MtaB
VRLSSLEASEATPELVRLMAAHPDRVCPHLHLPMQSGSDAVLARMRRPWPVVRFLDRCREIRRILDQPALTTDVIVGFPGETDEDFEATCRAAEEAIFAKIHVFPFSCREGTPAALMPDQVPFAIKQRRAERLTKIGHRLAQRYCESLLGRWLQILVESPLPGSSGAYVGTADRYVQVEVPNTGNRLNELVHVVAREAIEGRIRA